MENNQPSAKDYIGKILNLAERTELEKLAFNGTALTAIKKILLFGVYHNGTLEEGKNPDTFVNWAIDPYLFSNRNAVTDEAMGRFLRAKFEGISMIEAGIAQIENFKPVIEAPKEEVKNPAR